MHLAYDDTFAEFFSAATSDASTPVTIRWYRFGSRRPVVNSTGRVNVTVSEDGTLLSFQARANDTEGWAMLAGAYQCKATNGYSTAVVNFTLTIDQPPVPVITDGTEPDGNHQRHQSITSRLTFAYFSQDLLLMNLHH